ELAPGLAQRPGAACAGADQDRLRPRSLGHDGAAAGRLALDVERDDARQGGAPHREEHAAAAVAPPVVQRPAEDVEDAPAEARPAAYHEIEQLARRRPRERRLAAEGELDGEPERLAAEPEPGDALHVEGAAEVKLLECLLERVLLLDL